MINTEHNIVSTNLPRTPQELIADELHLMKTGGVIEVAIRNQAVSEYIQHWEQRVEKAETALEIAITEAEDFKREIKLIINELINEVDWCGTGSHEVGNLERMRYQKRIDNL